MHSTCHPRASIIHRKRILQRGHNYSQISDNNNPIQSPLDSHRKQKSGGLILSLLFNTFQRLMKSMTRYICRAISTSPCPLLVIIIGWQSSARILIRDFTSWPLELLGRTRKQSRWNVKIDTGREVATRIETVRCTSRHAGLYFFVTIGISRAYSILVDRSTRLVLTYLFLPTTRQRLILLENCQSR